MAGKLLLCQWAAISPTMLREEKQQPCSSRWQSPGCSLPPLLSWAHGRGCGHAAEFLFTAQASGEEKLQPVSGCSGGRVTFPLIQQCRLTLMRRDQLIGCAMWAPASHSLRLSSTGGGSHWRHFCPPAKSHDSTGGGACWPPWYWYHNDVCVGPRKMSDTVALSLL